MLLTRQLKRVFVLDGLRIADPLPGGELDDSVRALCQHYPQFRQTRVLEEDGQQQGEELLFNLELPPPSTNG